MIKSERLVHFVVQRAQCGYLSVREMTLKVLSPAVWMLRDRSEAETVHLTESSFQTVSWGSTVCAAGLLYDCF